MATRPRKANKVIVTSTLLAGLAAVLLLWQIAQLSGLVGVGTDIEGGTSQPSHLLLLGAVIVLGITFALLWAVLHNTRACNRAEMQLQWMTNRLPGAFYVFRLPVGGTGAYEFLTVEAGNLLGVPREQIIQDANLALRLVVAEDREHLKAAIKASHTHFSPLKADFRIQRPDGEVRWVRTVAVPVRESKEDAVWSGHLFDITESRLTEQALRDATQRLEYAQSVADLGDWTCDLATGEVTWSNHVYKLLGRDRELGPPSLADLAELPLEGPQPMADAFEEAQATGEPQSFEASTRLPDGTVITLDVIVLPVSDASGNVTGMRGTMQDITARKALEDRLTAAKEAADATNQAKSAFLATMSHEIRTPLNGMLGLIELIGLKPVDDGIRAALEAVHDSGQSLQRIIDDILDFSKVEAGKLSIFPEPTHLLQLVESVEQIYVGSAKRLGVDFQLHVDPEISPVLLLDPIRLRQILSNLISNALKFTPEGSVKLRVLSDGSDSGLECLRFEVVDTGIGIAPDEQKKLFQDFEQAYSVANRYGGSGLGLSISRRLAELMGGHVSMSSKLGEGTTMTLHLVALIANPALAPPKREPNTEVIELSSFRNQMRAPDPAPLEEPPCLPLTAEDTNMDTLILVVDDHPINRMVMRQQMHALGYAAEDVESGAEALERLQTGRFSLVLTDLNMPRMSGYDFTRRVREAELKAANGRIPIIACSANAITGVRQECLDAGMDDYISKPLNLQVLSEKLGQWLPGAVTPTPPSAALSQNPADAANGARSSDAAVQMPRTEKLDESPITRRAMAHFREVNDVDVGHLMDAIEKGDMATVTHMAHRIKGACGFINATGLASVCGMIEQAGRAEDGAGVAWLIDVFNLELEQLNATLDA